VLALLDYSYDRAVSKWIMAAQSVHLDFCASTQMLTRPEKVPETFYSRIPVLATLQAVEHGAERLLARRLVFFEAVRFSRQACDVLREAGAALRGEHSPAEKPVGMLQVRVLLAAVEMTLEQRVQSLSFSQ